MVVVVVVFFLFSIWFVEINAADYGLESLPNDGNNVVVLCLSNVNCVYIEPDVEAALSTQLQELQVSVHIARNVF